MKSVVALRNWKRKIVGLNVRALALAVVLGAMVFSTCGCKSWAASGETAAETNRRQKRVLRMNSHAMVDDIDTVLMMDRPSHLTDLRVP